MPNCTIGPAEYVGVPKTATDYKNPLPVAGRPNTYHVTVCNDGNWYGVWYPPEWKGNTDRVAGTLQGNNQHAYGNGIGGDNQWITLHKKNGPAVRLLIHVIDCVRERGQRGVLASAVPLFPNGQFEAFGEQFPPNNDVFRRQFGHAMSEVYPPNTQLMDRPLPCYVYGRCAALQPNGGRAQLMITH